MIRRILQYGFPALLAAALLWPVFGGRIDAVSLPTAQFSRLTVDRTADAYRASEKEARAIVDGVVNNALKGEGVDGEIDVDAVLTKGDLSSVYALDLPFQEKLAIANNVSALQEQTVSLLDRAKSLSQKSALIHQPSDGEGALNLLSSLAGEAGVDVSTYAGLANSAEDVLQDLKQYESQLGEVQKQMEKLQKAWQGLTVVLAAKPVFLPEKYDQDPNLVCIDYVGPQQLYGLLFANIQQMAMAELNNQYQSIEAKVAATVKEQEEVLGRFRDVTANPISQYEIAVAKYGDLSKLGDIAKSAISSQVSGVTAQLTLQLGASFAGTEAAALLGDVTKDLGNIESFAGKADAYKQAVSRAVDAAKEQNLGALTSGSPAERQAALAKIGTALGPDGKATVDRYAALLATAERYPEKKAETEAALTKLRGDMDGGYERAKRSALAKLDEAKELSTSLGGKSPTEIISQAAKAEGRVAWREAVNSVNVSELRSRILNLKNFQSTMQSQLDKIRELEEIFQKMTNMTKIIDYKSYLKRPTI